MGLFLSSAWLIPLLPFVGFVLITLTPLRQSKPASGWLAVLLMVAATVVALGVAGEVGQGVHVKVDGAAEVVAAGAHGESAAEGEHGFAFPEANIVRTVRWAPAGGGASFTMGYYIDPVVAAMLVMVTITSTCIHLFSLGYMAHDWRQARFFAYISLFTAAMLLMVLSSNLLLFFMAWEIMGLCSYLLIGFWYDKTYPDPTQITPRQAAIKAFITTRIGDVLMLVGLAYLWFEAGTLDFGAAPGQIFHAETLARLSETQTALGISTATAIALLLFCGTVGKSAQFPLHVWLPDAMEGPTPVSALIHAATMVAAGVFLVGRTFPIFEVSGALPVVARVGAFTAIFAALIAVGQYDIKRILAYSTLSQLGFMVAALGIGGWVAGLFHLLTHAFFKALLFLSSGSVIHGMETTVGHDSNTAQDIRNMGNLRKYMPVTFYTYMAGYLALAGIVPFAGFWSKDEILADAAKQGQWVVLLVLLAASFLTAFYMTRQVMLVFFGQFRGRQPRRDTHPSEPAPINHAHAEKHAVGGEHGYGNEPHESPWSMTLALVVLAVFAVVGGFVNLPFAGMHFLADFLQAEAGTFNAPIAGAATLLALAGIGVGVWLYRGAFVSASEQDPLDRMMPGLFRVLNGKFFVDELYAATIGRLSNGLTTAWQWFDRNVLDQLVNGVGVLTIFFGRLNFIVDDTVLNDGADLLADGTQTGGDRLRRVATGKIQDYLALVFLGVVVLGVLYVYGSGR
jgi:NADH-quinone oxidoreductase subunit L